MSSCSEDNQPLVATVVFLIQVLLENLWLLRQGITLGSELIAFVEVQLRAGRCFQGIRLTSRRL